MINLTTNDRKLLRLAHILWDAPDPTAEGSDGARQINRILEQQVAHLMRTQTRLVKERDYWYDAWRMTFGVLMLVIAVWMGRTFFF